MVVSFRTANLGDASEVRAIAEIHAEVPAAWRPDHHPDERELAQYEAMLHDHGASGSGVVLLACDEANIVGVHWLGEIDRGGQPCAYIHCLWVDEHHRRRGIARELKARGEAWARQRGAASMMTEVHHRNRLMIEFNQRLGFEAGQLEMLKRL